MGLTPLGIVHTAISLVAVAAALVAFARERRIRSGSLTGRVYVVTTILTCVTGFFIFQHGGFGKPHALGIVTLVVLGVAYAGYRGRFGARSEYVEAVAYSATFMFHMIPAITETSTRLPVGRPLLASAEAPELQAATGVLFVLFLLGAWWQVRRLRALRRAAPAALSQAA